MDAAMIRQEQVRCLTQRSRAAEWPRIWSFSEKRETGEKKANEQQRCYASDVKTVEKNEENG